MTGEQEPAWEPGKFLDPDTGDFRNLSEFDRQCDMLAVRGEVEPILTFLADKVSSDDKRESQLYRTFLLDFLERKVNDPEAVLFHAQHLTELAEARGSYIEAATTSRLVSSVHLEKGRFKHSATWFARMRQNLRKHAYNPPTNDAVVALAPGLIKDALEFESYYFLELAAKGKVRQVRAEVAELDKDPVVSAERHILASTLAFVESDLGNHLHALQSLKKAEKLAAETSDFAEASIYASRQTTQLMAGFGRMGVQAALEAAEDYLERACGSSRDDPELIAKAKEQLEGHRKALLS